MGRIVGRHVGSSRLRAKRGLGLAAFFAVAALGLSACFVPKPAPKPAPPAPTAPTTTTTTTTTAPPPPPAAHLTASPSSLSFNEDVASFATLETQTITITNDGTAPSGVPQLPDLSAIDEPGNLGLSDWSVSNWTCTSALAVGQSCQFDVGFIPQLHRNPPAWSGDVLLSASPGGTAHVSVTAQYTSELEYERPSGTLNATVATPAGTDVVLTNASAQQLNFLGFSLNTFGGMPPTAGTFSLGSDPNSAVPPCVTGMNLAPGASCHWMVTYTNTTGSGTNNANLAFSVGGLQGNVGFAGAGNP
jgi:hypothetical protein